MNGRSLCQLTRDQFTERTHWAGGDILFEHLSILQQEAEQKLINNANQQGPLDYSPSTNGNAVVLPLYPDHYQPPAHVYNHNSYQQQHHFEQYHYGFQHIPQGYPVIPPPHSMPYYRPYTVSNSFLFILSAVLILTGVRHCKQKQAKLRSVISYCLFNVC
jgi:hypothetical protein